MGPSSGEVYNLPPTRCCRCCTISLYPQEWTAVIASCLEGEGLTSIHKLTDMAGMRPFAELQRAHNLPTSEILRLLKNYVGQITTPRDNSIPWVTWFERHCRDDLHAKGMTTGIYAELLSDLSQQMPLYAARCQEDLGKTFSKEDWQKIWMSKKCSSNVLAQETSYKVLSRWYRSPVVVARYNQGVSSACFRGCGQEGTYFYTW